jgi:hypothetical protein
VLWPAVLRGGDYTLSSTRPASPVRRADMMRHGLGVKTKPTTGRQQMTATMSEAVHSVYRCKGKACSVQIYIFINHNYKCFCSLCLHAVTAYTSSSSNDAHALAFIKFVLIRLLHHLSSLLFLLAERSCIVKRVLK